MYLARWLGFTDDEATNEDHEASNDDHEAINEDPGDDEAIEEEVFTVKSGAKGVIKIPQRFCQSLTAILLVLDCMLWQRQLLS